MSNNLDNFDDIENKGRTSTPHLPIELRASTLTRCAQAVHQQNRQRRQRGWTLIGILAGVCAIHWLAISTLNAQNTTLIGGNNSNQIAARFAMTPEEYQKFQHQRAQLFVNSDAAYTFGNKVGGY